jgi:4,5-dihydroxyphthalate decarboxylase
MAKLPLTFACGLYDRMVPLYAGEVSPERIDLKFLPNPAPRDIFDRMAGGLEFDAAEMSSSELISRLCAGDRSFVAIPVFPSRMFRHGLISVNRQTVKTPKDLEGKRVGVPLHTMTAAIFIRGMLQHDHGIDLSTIQWVQGAINSAGAHGSPSVLPLLKPVSIENNETGKSLSDLLDEGSIDAIIGTRLPLAMRHNPNIQRLFPNFQEVERDYYQRTRIFPIMHLVALRRDVYERHPFIAKSLYDALSRSKQIALERMRGLVALQYMLPWMAADIEEIDRVFGGDPWPYGVEANRPTLEALVTYMVEQSLIANAIPVEDIFVPVWG